MDDNSAVCLHQDTVKVLEPGFVQYQGWLEPPVESDERLLEHLAHRLHVV